jgi:CheY-like chemotaxis protein
MKVFKNISEFLLSDNHFVETKPFTRPHFINLFIILFVSVLGIYTYSLIRGTDPNKWFIVVNLVMMLLLVFDLILANRLVDKTLVFTGNFLLGIATLYFVGALLMGNIQGIQIFWLSAYPIIALLSTKGKANLYALLFLVVIVMSWITFPFHGLNDSGLSTAGKLLFLLAYAGNFLVVYLIISRIYRVLAEKKAQIFRLQDEIRDKEDFISKVSHQIRTPLNNIVVVSNMLNPSELSGQAKDYFDTILASTNNLVDVVNSFSDITNVDVQERKRYEIRFDVNNTLHNTKNLFVDKEYDSEEHPIHIHSQIDFPLIGDPVKIKQIFLNLIEQVLKHSRTNQIEIDIYKKDENSEGSYIDIVFALSTFGLQHMDREINERTETGRSKKIIEKLELHIAKRIVESLGGVLKISTLPEKHSFQFILKFKKAEPEQPQKNTVSEQTGVAGAKKEKIDLKDASVLLVEDNLINQKIVVLSLKKSVKNVDVANNGKEALDKFGSVKYDIILMDIQMPIMNGIVTTQKIRNIEKSSNTHTPIIAITANALLGDKEDCLAAGTDDYISKPFQIETLLEKMRTLL